MSSLPNFFYSGTEVVNHQLPEIGFWVEGIVPKHGIVLLHGKYGSYKTPLSVHLAHSIAVGQDFVGLSTEQAPVLYIEGDTPMPGIWPRLQKMNPDTDQLDFAFIYPGFNVVQPKIGEHNKMVCDQLAERHAAKRYGLVVIDSLRTSHNLPDKDSEVPSIVYGSLARLFPGSTIMIIHHDRKTKPPDGKHGRQQSNVEIDNESFSGSQAFIDRATTSLKIQKGYAAEKEWITLSQTKSQVGKEIDPLQLKVTDGCLFNLASAMLDDEITLALASIGYTNGQLRNRAQLDKALAGYFQVPEKWARTRRANYESTVNRLFEKE
jgi:hypothetical protein